MSRKYRTSTNAWYTRQLFYEPWSKLNKEAQVAEPVFSFTGRPGYIDAHTTFVNLGDPTGYKWAIEFLESYQHFEVLLNCDWFKSEFDKWVHEIEVKMRSEAIEKLREVAAGDSAQATVAAKFISTLDYKKGSKGRPSNAEIKGELRRQVRIIEEESDDAARIGLKVV